MTPADPAAVHRRFQRILDRVDAEFTQMRAELRAIDEGASRRIREVKVERSWFIQDPGEIASAPVEIGIYQDEVAAD